tara:strand:+ start:774 stop:1334 length:561 start_codon:yes stop_codon:yes gene_type:complete
MNERIIPIFQKYNIPIDNENMVAFMNELYDTNISINNGLLSKGGADFENIISHKLNNNGISFREQVVIDENGIIKAFNTTTIEECFHKVDFVVGENIEIGRSIEEFMVLSCKTTCRERWKQDDWSLVTKPKKYILLTVSNDYPPSAKFQESETRKIITENPKKRDNRVYKLNYDSLISEITELVER